MSCDTSVRHSNSKKYVLAHDGCRTPLQLIGVLVGFHRFCMVAHDRCPVSFNEAFDQTIQFLTDFIEQACLVTTLSTPGKRPFFNQVHLQGAYAFF